jgi:hypothetical protein
MGRMSDEERRQWAVLLNLLADLAEATICEDRLAIATALVRLAKYGWHVSIVRANQ